MIELLNSLFSCVSMSHTDLRDNGSRPDVGSSKIINSGVPSTAIAIETFLLFPPDNYFIFLLNSSLIRSMFTIESIVSL